MGSQPSARRCCCASPTQEQIALLLPDQAVNIDGSSSSTTAAVRQTSQGESTSIIQFTSAIVFTSEGDGEATLDLLRLGDASEAASCDFHTEDSSAKAGKIYHATSGQVKFAAGEKSQSISVKLYSDDAWNATLEFKVILTNVKNAQLGKYLYQCSVKVIDEDPFPGNRFREQLLAGEEEQLSGVSLMWEYFWLMMRNDLIWKDTIKCLLLDQFTGVYFVLTVYLQMYLVDVVLSPHKEGESEAEGEDERRILLSGIHTAARMLGRCLGEEEEDEPEINLGLLADYVPHNKKKVALIIGVLYTAPFLIQHIIDYYKCFLAVPCEVRKVLQGNLMRQFLNYNESVRNRIKQSEVIMVMIRDVIEIADKGFMKILTILKILGKLGFALIFILTENRYAAIPLVVYPIILGCWLCLRERKTIEINEEKAMKQDELVEAVEYAVQQYNLISDFHLREPVTRKYEGYIDAYHDVEASACAVVNNNCYAAPWLTTLFVGTYMALSAFMVETVSDGTLSLGTFLSTVNVFKEIGAEIAEIYLECMEVQLSFGPLKKITRYINYETDLVTRMEIGRRRKTEGAHAREQARATLSQQQKAEGALAVDNVKIQVKDLSYSYAQKDQKDALSQGKMPKKVLSNVTVSFDQGKLYAFVGPPREGKATFLKLLGEAIYTQSNSGDIFVPPHLRVLHVCREATILRRTSFLDNVIMNNKLKDVGGITRVAKICERLRFPKHMLEELRKGEKVDDAQNGDKLDPKTDAWAATLSHTDYSRLNLARVFVGNPEVMVLHKPAAAFDDNEREQIVMLLREHVDEKGLEMPKESKSHRRPRTLFFTSSTTIGVQQSDKVYKVSLRDGVQPISKDRVSSVSSGMLS